MARLTPDRADFELAPAPTGEGPGGEMMDARSASEIQFSFDAEVIYWRGPSPFFFAPLPPQQAEELRRVSSLVTYGWGMIPVDAAIGGVTFYTALFPKDETYLLPLKAAVRRKTNITAGDTISVEMTLKPAQR